MVLFRWNGFSAQNPSHARYTCFDMMEANFNRHVVDLARCHRRHHCDRDRARINTKITYVGEIRKWLTQYLKMILEVDC